MFFLRNFILTKDLAACGHPTHGVGLFWIVFQIFVFSILVFYFIFSGSSSLIVCFLDPFLLLDTYIHQLQKTFTFAVLKGFVILVPNGTDLQTHH